MRDVTKRYGTGLEFPASELRFRALLTATSNVFYHMNPDWTEMRQLDGGGFISDTEAPTRDWLQQYIPLDDQETVLRAIRTAVQSKSVFELEHRVLRADGSMGWTLSRAVPLLDDTGSITEWFGAATDTTDRKRAEQDRERLMAELTRSNEDLFRFTHVASHDLRSPLNTISQFSELLLKRYSGKVLDENGAKLLNVVMLTAQRMVSLTSDLLRYATVCADTQLPVEPVSASRAVEQAIANLTYEIEQQGAEVRFETLPEVRVESTLLLQIFQNLIGNAIKYRTEQAPRIYITAEAQETYCLFEVQDNGIGIEEKQQACIFEPFKRLHGPEVAGTGIGLPICARIVERLGGRIWVKSAPGHGSTFTFTLPR